MRYLPALLIAGAGAALSLSAAHYQERENHQVLQQRLERILGKAADGIAERIQNYRNVLRGLRGMLLVAGPDAITQEQVARYLANIDVVHEFPGARGFGYVRRVSEADEADYVARRRRVHEGFALRQFAPTSGDRFVIQLIEPIDGNTVALGLDLASEPNRRRAALAAMRSGSAQLTAPIELVQPGATAEPAFLLLLPVYDLGVIPAPAERATHLTGWTYTPLLVRSFVDGMIDPSEAVTLGLEDVTDGRAESLLTAAAASVMLQTDSEITVFGRRWRLSLSAGEQFVAQQGLPRPSTTLGIGLAASATLAALALLAAASRRRSHEVRVGQAKLAAIVDSAIDAIISKDLSGRITSWNRGAETLFGHTAQEAIGRTAAELLVPAERMDEENGILSMLAAGAPVADLETVRRHKDGHLIDVWLSISPVRGAGDQVNALAVTIRDITERKAAEERVRAANARLEDTVISRTAELTQLNALLGSVLDAATGVAIIATSADGVITLFNRGAELMLGHRAKDMIGLATPQLFHDHEELAARIAEIAAAEGRTVDGFTALVIQAQRAGAETREWTFVRRDGGRIAVSLIVSAIHDAEGRISGYLGVAVDITARQELVASLNRAREQADKASEAKSSFLANMSHEIRTPLNAVLGMLGLLHLTALDPRQHDYASKAEMAARTLLQLLNDVLDFSKIEAGKLILDPHPFELDGLMRDLAAVLSGNHGDKLVETLFDIDPRLPAWLVGDRMRLQQILINLAGNALKFTERGSVTVSVELLRRGEDGAHIRFGVRDTGIGITPEQREQIFQGFTQAEASISRRFGGTGLGLVISRRLLAQMGATLELDSTPGVGSDFWFELVLKEQEQDSPATPCGNLRVLVVDDHPAAGEALLRMVLGMGWEGTLAGGGAEALALVRGATAPYDVVLLDWRMPAPDGLETAHAIRLGGGQPPIVLMVTAAGSEMLLADCDGNLAAPFAGVLTKPVTPRLIEEAVLRARRAAPETMRAPRPQRLAGMRILLVEDNALNRQVAGELLESEGAAVVMAHDGSQGLDYLLSCEALPDAVLMDMQMPVMDGIEATRRIRSRLGGALPIIAMTANAGAADRQCCIEAGMSEHLGKPIDLEALVHALRPAGLQAQGRIDGEATLTLRSASADAMQGVLARFGGDVGIYLRSLDAFLPEAEVLMAQVRAALSRADLVAAAAALHGLKGAAGTVGARDLSDALTAAERASRAGADAYELLRLLDENGQCTNEGLRAACAGLRQAALPYMAAPPQEQGGAIVVDISQLDDLLATGNMRALALAEQLTAQATPGSRLALFDSQVRDFDFASARITLATLRETGISGADGSKSALAERLAAK